MKKYLFLFLIAISFVQLKSADLYFPPIIGNTWETISPSSLGWDEAKVQPLYDFMEQQNSKAFIVLKDGKIVLEKYFGTFTQDSAWYWASAGKTITSFLVGKAQEDGFLKITEPTSKYLGKGWTVCPPDKEDKITIHHQLTMTSGLDDGVPDNHCTIDSCLIYKADAGARWAYHNAPYTLLEKVLTTATSSPINTYTYQKLGSKTGINGLWYTVDYDNVFFSKPRNMARFGLLFLNNCVWNKDSILKDRNYFNEMINTSQSLNKSYGYLWWLNGKESFMVPTLQTVFQGSYAPNAPKDMYAALGKNGQILSIAPSQGLVIVRMGDKPDDQGEMALTLVNQIWQKLNEIMKVNSIGESDNSHIILSPNPASDYIYVNCGNYTLKGVVEDKSFLQMQESAIMIYNIFGECVLSVEQSSSTVQRIDISSLPEGGYFVRVGDKVQKFVVVR